jgi:hypothetical protein
MRLFIGVSLIDYLRKYKDMDCFVEDLVEKNKRSSNKIEII